MLKPLVAVVVSAALILPVAAATAARSAPAEAETVGDFAMKLSGALGVEADTNMAAATALRGAGVRLGVDLDARLTYGHAARMLSDLGLKVTPPADPDGQVSRGKALQIALTASRSTFERADISQEDLPIECLNEKNHGKCVNCCKLKVQTIPNLPPDSKIARSCSKFCRSTQPPPSESAPL